MGKDKDDADLRKEVELTEHQDSIEAVCRQYETDADKGLTTAVAEEVSFDRTISDKIVIQCCESQPCTVAASHCRSALRNTYFFRTRVVQCYTMLLSSHRLWAISP